MRDGKSAWDAATAGTYVDSRVPRTVLAIVLAIALALAVVPSIGMLWARTDTTTENRQLADPPALFHDDGSFNWNVLADAGDYFADHFAYRNQLVSANARIRAALGTSATDQVVIGDDGWLYYGGTLPDFLGQSALSDRGLRNIAHNLRLAQGYVESEGAQFAFTLAPNKNTLYSQHMPYYYLQDNTLSNAERLKPLLEEAGVNYVDLFDLFEGDSGEWYLKKDSHWDNRGALMATQVLLEAVDHATLALDVEDAIGQVDFSGDLESMLYPSGAVVEQNWYFAEINDGEGMSGSTWSYVEGADVTDSWIVTSSQSGTGNVLMFRDSFGNSLLPLWATAFKQGAFSKLVPYNLPTLVDCQADTVVIERAERHLSSLAEDPPIMPNPTVRFKAALPKTASSNSSTLEVAENGPYWMISGAINSDVVTDTARLYLAVELQDGSSVVYDAFWTSTLAGTTPDTPGTDFGFLVYAYKKSLPIEGATVRIYAIEDDSVDCLGVFDSVLSQ